jgi:hypothetical protein
MKVTFYSNDGKVLEERGDAEFVGFNNGELVLSYPVEPIPLCDREEFQYVRIYPKSPWGAGVVESGDSLWWEVNGEALIGLSSLDTALLDLTKVVLPE